MSIKIICVVGNRFLHFSRHDEVHTFSQFVEKMSQQDFCLLVNQIVLGQGLGEEEKQILTTIAVNKGIKVVENILANLASSDLTHKHQVDNIMISDPIKASKDFYLARLLLNDECAEMSDHMTGQHIQGMVFTWGCKTDDVSCW